MRVRLVIALLLGLAAAILTLVWPAAPRARLHHDHICWHLAFSRDSTRLAALVREAGLNVPSQVLVWDVATGTLLHRLNNGMRVYPSKIAFAPDGRSLGIVDAGAVTLWDLNTGRMLAHHDHAAWSHDPDRHLGRELLFSAEGKWLAHDLHAGHVYDVETGTLVHDYSSRWPERTLEAHGGCIAALVEGQIMTFDVLTGAEVGTFPGSLKRGPMARTALSFRGEGTHVFYFSNTNQWVLYNSAAARSTLRDTVVRLDADVFTDCCLSADKRHLALSLFAPTGSPIAALRAHLLDTRRQVRVFDTTTGREVCRPFTGGFMPAFAPDGTTLAVADRDQSLALWDWPLPSRWPLALAAAVTTFVLSCLAGTWRAARRVTTKVTDNHR